MLQAISRILLGVFFMVAGFNHFISPDFYLPLIPDYFPEKETINWLSGVVEILLGIGVLWQKTRYIASLGIIALLVAFIPSHVHFIQIGSCIEGGLCVPQWLGWLRLLFIHPLLILWAWNSRGKS